MRRITLLVILCLALLPLSGIAQLNPAAGVKKVFDWQTTTGKTAVFNLVTTRFATYPTSYTVQFVRAGDFTGATCTYAVEGVALEATDPDPVVDADYQNVSGDLDCATVRMIHITNKPLAQLRGNLKALSGGTSPKLRLVIVAVR